MSMCLCAQSNTDGKPNGPNGYLDIYKFILALFVIRLQQRWNV